jgi:uncharacterized surface protein with fasciclin (FAS1) repeats
MFRKSALAWVLGAAMVAAAGFVAAPAARAGDDHKHEGEHHSCGQDHSNSILSVAKKDGNFNTLAAAVAQAGLEEAFQHDELTVFAPTDEAFARLPSETLDALLKPENKEKLKAVLLYHAVKGKTTSCCLSGESTVARTVGGKDLTVRKSADGVLTVNTARVIKADVPADNGVIHAIDTVLIPDGVL